jgi:protein-tyrosine phosphatase
VVRQAPVVTVHLRSTESAVRDRHLDLDTVFNFRDLGGYATADGRTVRWGRLYRADGIHRLSGSDLDRVRELGIRTVLDLRTPREYEAGCFPVDDHPVDHHHLPVMAETWDEAELVERAEDYLTARYLDMLDEGSPALAGAVRVLSRAESFPVVFHCAAGKDRTGVLAALLLSVLGVPDDVIAQDYGLSALGMERMQAWLQEHSPEGAEVMARQPAGWLAAPPEAMEAFLAEVRLRHGGFAGYLRRRAIGSATLDAVRTNLLT